MNGDVQVDAGTWRRRRRRYGLGIMGSMEQDDRSLRRDSLSSRAERSEAECSRGIWRKGTTDVICFQIHPLRFAPVGMTSFVTSPLRHSQHLRQTTGNVAAQAPPLRMVPFHSLFHDHVDYMILVSNTEFPLFRIPEKSII